MPILYESLQDPMLTVKVINVETNAGISGAEVYLFEGGGPIESPERATYHAVTDAEGAARFDVYGFFRVGVFAKGYEATEEPHIPPVQWKNTWTCWGAVGVARDITYPFNVKPIGVPPEEVRKFPTALIIGGAIVTAIISGIILTSRRKR